jgi:hypothetical protein
LPDPQHHPLDIRRVLTEETQFERKNVMLEVRLGRLDLAVSADPLIGDDPHHRVAANNGALEIDDLHLPAPPPITLPKRPLQHSARLQRRCLDFHRP